MSDIVLAEGENRLDVQMMPIPPNIELVSLDWDATPPFETASRHVWTLRMQNLVSFPVIYQLQFYMNGVLFMGYTAYLTGNEVRDYSQPYTFKTAGTYTLIARAYCGDKLLDEISSTVTVEVPPTPPVIAGQVLIGYVLIAGQWVQITSSNSWPAQLLQYQVKVKNTGNVYASFTVSLHGGYTNIIGLNPGESGFVSGTFWAIAGSLSIVLYGDGQAVQSDTVYVTTY